MVGFICYFYNQIYVLCIYKFNYTCVLNLLLNMHNYSIVAFIKTISYFVIIMVRDYLDRDSKNVNT